ncbi:helix-turn-helix transcriptional regulator [Streptomyces xiaopingdaonensis]|uniref:helix-turn-helix transcriptional regulator n=1 Tax=Streptomyces xiaopingdaonensis TaxID=1565415 RepID=UPI0002E4C96F|nr:LuxR C-terminal-related transcriptional regulator [Streptomyces xiaopingdaonensis]
MVTASAVAAPEWERMLDLAVAVLHERDPDRLWPLLAAQLPRVCGGDVLIRKAGEWSAEAGALLVATAEGPGAGIDEETGAAIRRCYPLADHYVATRDRMPATARGIAPAGWRRSETARLVRRAFGAGDVMGLPLPVPTGPVTGFLLFRAGGFDDAHLECARRLQPLVAGVAGQREVLDGWRASASRAGAEPAERAAAHGLTPRETAVLALLAEALTAAAIGRRLGISRRTVHKHVENLYRKLGTRDRMETVLRAQAHGLLGPPG